MTVSKQKFEVKTSWDGSQLPETDIVSVSFSCEHVDGKSEPEMRIKLDAPFYDNPPPKSTKDGSSCACLWEFEVVEIFLKGRMDKYIEIELSPHDEYLILAMDGHRQCFHEALRPLSYKCGIVSHRWWAELVIPFSYLPPPFVAGSCSLFTFNVYALHNDREGSRRCAALFPSSESFDYDSPDTHRLHLFEGLPREVTSPYFDAAPEIFAANSSVWKERIGAELRKSTSFTPIDWD